MSKLKKANSYRISQELLRNKALRNGVNLIAPETIFLSKDTIFGKNVTVEPYVVFGSRVKVGDNSYIKSFTHIEGTKIEKNVTIGPYARLRPGTILKNYTKIGNFVETKKTSINVNSKVSHLSYVGDTKIGKNSKIHSHVVIDGNTTIGSNNEIYSFSVLGSKPQHLKYQGEKTELLIGNNNVFREHVTVHPGTKVGVQKTFIGDNGFFMVGSHVAHDCLVGNNVVFVNNAVIGGHVEISDFVLLISTILSKGLEGVSNQIIFVFF